MGSSPPKIELLLGNSGRKFDRWTTVDLNMGITDIAHSFNLTHVDKSAEAKTLGVIADSVNEGDRVRIKVNGQDQIDGYVDTVDVVETTRDGPMVSITGRSATADLVDCGAQHESGEWQDTRLLDIANQLVAPFDLKTALGDGALDPSQLAELSRRIVIPFRRVCIEPGETVADIARRMADERGLLVTTDAKGNLAFTIAGARKIIGQLKRGVNIGSGARRRGDARERFSIYRIFGQSAGDDAWHGESARGGDATAEDDQVTRYRPLVMSSDGTASDGDYQARADWERNKRAGRARSLSLPILSWINPERKVWRPNRIIDVDHPVLRIKGELLIERVALRFDIDTGDTGVLTLVNPGTYDPLQKPKTRRNRKMWATWV